MARPRRQFVGLLMVASAAVAVALTSSPAGAQRASQFVRGSCAPLDLAFVVDTTGSMGPAISNVKAGLNRIVDEANVVAAGNLRLGVIEFKDNVVVRTPFADNNESAAKSAINSLSASGGDSEPEASDVALETAVKGLRASQRAPGQQTGDFQPPFRPAAEKIAVLITDAHPGGFDDSFTGADTANARAVADAARAAGIRISSIYVPTFSVNSEERSIMRTYATVSRGQFRQTSSTGSGTATAIDATIATCAGTVARRLKVTASPRVRTAGSRTCYRFRVTSGGRPVRNATVRFARRSARTNRRGRARICVRFASAGRRGVLATRSGFVRARTSVFISRPPSLTG